MSLMVTPYIVVGRWLLRLLADISKNLITTIWNTCPQVDIQNRFDSLPHHIEALKISCDGFIKYWFATCMWGCSFKSQNPVMQSNTNATWTNAVRSKFLICIFESTSLGTCSEFKFRSYFGLVRRTERGSKGKVSIGCKFEVKSKVPSKSCRIADFPSPLLKSVNSTMYC